MGMSTYQELTDRALEYINSGNWEDAYEMLKQKEAEKTSKQNNQAQPIAGTNMAVPKEDKNSNPAQINMVIIPATPNMLIFLPISFIIILNFRFFQI